MKNRWYDKHEGLANHLEALKTLPKKRLNELLKDLIAFARLLHPTLFEEHLLEYPLDLKRRRWYDDDPYLWLVVNGLRFADDEIINKIVAFFDKQLGLKPTDGVSRAAARRGSTAAGKSALKKGVKQPSSAKTRVTKQSSAKKSAASKKRVQGRGLKRK